MVLPESEVILKLFIDHCTMHAQIMVNDYVVHLIKRDFFVGFYHIRNFMFAAKNAWGLSFVI